MKQEINLKQILADNANMARDEDGNQIYYEWEVLNMLKQACLETLELAADNATASAYVDYEDNYERRDVKGAIGLVNEDSILNLKDKIK